MIRLLPRGNRLNTSPTSLTLIHQFNLLCWQTIIRRNCKISMVSPVVSFCYPFSVDKFSINLAATVCHFIIYIDIVVYECGMRLQ